MKQNLGLREIPLINRKVFKSKFNQTQRTQSTRICRKSNPKPSNRSKSRIPS